MFPPGDVGGFEVVRVCVCVCGVRVRDVGGVYAREPGARVRTRRPSTTTRGACCYKYKHPHVVISKNHIGIFLVGCPRGLCVPVCAEVWFPGFRVSDVRDLILVL